MKYNAIIMGLSLVLTACGSSSSGGGKKKVIKFSSLSMNPITLQKENTRCSSADLLEEEKIFTVTRLINKKPVEEIVNLQSFLQNNQLVDANKDLLNAHLYDVSKRRVLEVVYYDENSFDITTDIDEVDNAGLTNSVCADNMSYARNSYENVGLIVTNALTKTRSAITSLISDSIPSVSVSLTPLEYSKVKVTDVYGNVYQDEEGYRTNNAYYSPSEKALVFLPGSKEVEAAGIFEKPFWEIPMVASHEYGHHIFDTLYPNFEHSNMHQDILHDSCFDTRFNTNTEMMAVSEARTTERSDIVGGFNEGFADLMAQYTLSESENYLGDLNCFRKNREVKSPKFADGTIKKFNAKNIRLLFSSKEYETSSCNKANIQEIHHMGAVFAHVTDAIQSSYGLTNTEKLQNILTWIKALNEDENLNLMGGRDYFENSLRKFVKIMHKNYGNINDDIIRDYLSGVSI